MSLCRFVSLFCLLISCVHVRIYALDLTGNGYERTPDGIIVRPETSFSGGSDEVRLRVIADNIIRVIAGPVKDLSPGTSEIIALRNGMPARWSDSSDKGNAFVTTRTLLVRVDLRTGAVAFFNRDGSPIAEEKKMNGRFLKPAVFEGKRSYNISQTFTVDAGEGLYGLGQHQDGLFNYNGYQVTLFQNNTKVAVPFLISARNYGILWDNASVSTVGDVRDYHALSALKLYSPEGKEGWLSATYSNDYKNPSQITLRRAESCINMEYLNDSKTCLPGEFDPAKGMVSWEGAIASEFSGIHKFRFTYSGYFKVYLDDSLVLDRWRQAWNPGSAILDIPLQKDKKQLIKIIWVPCGAESYVSVKWLEPVAAGKEREFTFASEAGASLNYYFIHGNNMDEVISGYRSLTGRASLVPEWALGLWQSRERYKTQQEVVETVKEFRKRKIPLDNIVLDWSYWKEAEWGAQEFDGSRFPQPDSMISLLHRQYNAHFMISVWPKFYEGIDAYNAFDSQGWLFRRNIADRQKDWIGKGYTSTFYDAFNPDARKAFWALLNKKLFSKGIDAWWMDASEPDIVSNVSPERRKELMTGAAGGILAENLNAYPLLNAKSVYEGQRLADPSKRVFILTRSAFAGSQRYGAAVWSGDIAARWEDMKAQIPAGINMSMSGIPYWTMDIGGFATENRYGKPNAADLDEWREQNTRWYQFGAFCPVFRVHGQFPFREVYNIAPEEHPAYKSMVYYDKLRYSLLPYIYSLAGKTYHDDYTIMRGLIMDFPGDSNVLSLGDQYMFGPSLMISPVYSYKATTRKVYLPASAGWYDLYTGKYFTGGQTIVAGAPYERMPVFVKEGSIIPTGPDLQYTSEKKADTITLFVYTGKDAGFTLYEDEGINNNYEQGKFTKIPFDYSEKTRSLTIGEIKGTFEGMLSARIFKIVWIGKDRPGALQPGKRADVAIKYTGRKVTVVHK